MKPRPNGYKELHELDPKTPAQWVVEVLGMAAVGAVLAVAVIALMHFHG